MNKLDKIRRVKFNAVDVFLWMGIIAAITVFGFVIVFLAHEAPITMMVILTFLMGPPIISFLWNKFVYKGE